MERQVKTNFSGKNSLVVKSTALTLGLLVSNGVLAGMDRWTATGSLGSPGGGFISDSGYAVMNPNDPNTWFLVASANESDFDINIIYKSNNAGKSWKILHENAEWRTVNGSQAINELLVAPSNPEIMYLLMVEDFFTLGNPGDVFQSIDGGVHWTKQTTREGLRALAVHPSNPNILYAHSELHQSMVKSVDGGKTWSAVGSVTSSSYSLVTLFDTSDPSVVYYSNDYKGEVIYRSQNDGNSFQVLDGTESNIPLKMVNPFWSVNNSESVAYKKDDNNLLVVSLDKGVTWQSTTSLPEVAWPSTFSWENQTKIIGILPYFGMFHDPINESGIHVVLRNGDDSLDIGMTLLRHWALTKSMDYGATWETPTIIQTYKRTPLDQLIVDSAAKTLYEARSGRLVKSTDNGASWQIVGELPEYADGYLKFGTSPEILYFFEKESSNIHRSVDVGITWEYIYTKKSGYVQTFYDNPSNPDEIYLFDYVCIFSCTPELMMKSIDGGQTWTNIEDAVLPGTEVKYKEVNHISGNGATHYAATDKGIYISRDSGATWAQFNSDGLPFAQMEVNEVRIDPNDSSVLYADTEVGTFVYGKNSPPNVNSAEIVSQTDTTAKIAVYGNYLDIVSLSVTLPECANMTQVDGGDDMTQYFQCEITGEGEQTGEIKDAEGTLLNSFSVTLALPQPTVSEVSPLNAMQNETMTFTISGENFPQSLNISVADCEPVQTFAPETCTETQCQHTCTPSTSGKQVGSIEDTDGNSLYTFEVEVQAAPTINPVELNEACSYQACNYSIQIDQPGFYVATVNLPEGGKEGLWGVEFKTSGGINTGGFNSGAILKEDGDRPGFMAFNLSKAGSVDITPHEYTGKIDTMKIQLSRQENGARTVVFGPKISTSGQTHTTPELESGFYVAEALSEEGSPRGRFGFEILSDSMSGGVNIGGWIDSYTGGGFGGLYVANSQTVEVNVLFGESYSSIGANYVELNVYRQEGGERTLIFPSE